MTKEAVYKIERLLQEDGNVMVTTDAGEFFKDDANKADQNGSSAWDFLKSIWNNSTYQNHPPHGYHVPTSLDDNASLDEIRKAALNVTDNVQ